jgi:DeoR/GlpR family transcriptional regulator of sugar metabolism
MTNKQRTDLIEKHIRENKYADLRTLANRFGGSLSTVRRALDSLEERGLVRRHHGGASLIETDALAQDQIARLVADEVRPGMTVIMDGGSTTYAVAKLLAEKRVRVITNSLPIASLFGEVGQVDAMVTGGNIFGRLGVMVGPLCEQSFSQVHADLAILGGTGVTEGGIWNHHAFIITAQRRMLAAAERSIFAIDNTKFGRKALSLTAAFDPRITVVTDVTPEPAVAQAIATHGARLRLADGPPPARRRKAPGGGATE